MASKLIIEAGRVLAADGDLTPGHVIVEEGRITAVRGGPADPPASVGAVSHRFPRCTLAPGFIDLQVNGAAGVDFLSVRSPEDLQPAARHLAETGVTAFLPTLVTAGPEAVRRALQVIGQAGGLRPRILGVHLEGPFLNPAYAGAHDPALLRPPDRESLRALLEGFDGLVRLMTLAPELAGADALIDDLRREGIIVAAGHTDAGFDAALRAFDRGVSMVTHLFNAMRPFHHREPGVVGAVLEDTRVGASLILDGVHVHSGAARLACRLLGPDRAVLVTDAIAAAGAPPGRYRLGSRDVTYDGTAPRLADGTLAGSVLAMDRAVAAAVALGWPLRDAVRMAAETPARILGLPAQARLAPGADGDLVVLDEALHVELTVCAGEVIYRRNQIAGPRP